MCVRIPQASTEAETCSTKMEQMENGLEDFYFRLEETDQWLDAAIEKSQDLQAAQHSVEEQFNTFRVSAVPCAQILLLQIWLWLVCTVLVQF